MSFGKIMAAAALAAASTMAAAAPATSAVAAEVEPQDSGCASGQFCVFDYSGNIILSTGSDWYDADGLYGGYSYFNNGKPQPGYDHIELTYEWPLSSGGYWTGHRCIHRGHPEGLGDFDQDVVYIVHVRWRGECT